MPAPIPLPLPLRPRPPAPPLSPLVLCDRLIGLAQDAQRAGFAVTAEHLLYLAETLFEPAAGD